jgi:hypothetical protein
MFEKEAEEWVKENMDCCKTDNSVNQSISYFDEEERCCAKSAFQDGAEFGYNKAKIEVEESYRESLCNSELNLASVTEQLEELEKANEWHYVKDENPNNENDILCQISKDEVEVGYYHTKEKRYYTIDGQSIDVIRWQEIVLPKEIE